MRQPHFLRPVPDAVNATISIVVPCHNSIDLTMVSLTSLLHYTDLPFELIMVNDGSTDGTATSLDILTRTLNSGHAKVTRAHVIHNPARTGCAHASNMGVALTTGQIIVWCNNDMLYSPNWLSPLVRIVASHAEVGIAGPWPIQPPAPFRENPVLEFGEYAATQANPADGALYSTGAPWVFRRDILGRVGGFFLDTRFSPAYYEDWDLYNRLIQAGLHFGLSRRSVYYHYGGMTCGRFPDRAQIHQTNRWRFLTKWPNGGPLPGYLGLQPYQMGL